MLPNFTLSFISFFTKKHASINVKSSLRSINVRYYIIFLFILLIPYLMRLPNANIRNLLFLDVYDSRIDFRGTGSIYLNYFTATLSKLIIPIILMLSLKHKNYFGVLLSFISIIVIFLTTGALKSVLLSYGIFAFFIFGNSVNKKVFNFIIVINIIVLFEILSYTLLGQAIFSSYIRRIFFTSGRLFVEYIDYFKDNLTYFTHTRIHEIFYGFRSYDQITLWFGENILGRSNMNASVGYLTEFTFSLGFFGALLASFIFAAIVFLFDLLDLNIKYVGLVFILTETMRNSLFETSLITNGVFFMILAMIFIIPKNERTIRHVK
jgi:hypothetical protein